MGTRLFVSTAHGLAIFDRKDGSWQEAAGRLTGQTLTGVATDDIVILLGTPDGILRSGDGGETWWNANEGLTVRHVRWLAFHPDQTSRVFAGTEPAAIFLSLDGGQTWQECPEVARLRDEYDWNLPYSSNAGCVRGFAFHGTRGYAAVEQGGLLGTEDSGETWDLVEGSSGDPHSKPQQSSIHPDVHSVEVHPSSADQVFAPTAGGLYYSSDGGRTWSLLYEGYCRAVWVDPQRPAHMLLGPADGVDRRGRIEETIDGGKTWEPAMVGLDEVWPEYMVNRFVQVEDELFAVLSNGRLIRSARGTLDWNWKPMMLSFEGATAAVPLAV